MSGHKLPDDAYEWIWTPNDPEDTESFIRGPLKESYRRQLAQQQGRAKQTNEPTDYDKAVGDAYIAFQVATHEVMRKPEEDNHRLKLYAALGRLEEAIRQKRHASASERCSYCGDRNRGTEPWAVIPGTVPDALPELGPIDTTSCPRCLPLVKAIQAGMAEVRGRQP